MADTFSPEELGEAQALVDRKLSGKRIINPGGRIGQAYAFLINSPENLRALGDIAGRSASTSRDPAIGSAVGGGVIRQSSDGSTYVDRRTSPSQSVREFRSGFGKEATRNTVELVQTRGGIEGFSDKLGRKVDILVTRQQRSGRASRGITSLGDAKTSAQVLFYQGSRSVVDAVIGIKNLPKASSNLIKTVVNNPRSVVTYTKSIPKKIDRGGQNVGRLLRTSPDQAIAKVGSEYLILRGTGKSLKVAGKLTERAAARIAPDFVGEARIGNKINIRSTGKNTVKLEIVGRIPKETLKRQISLEGRRINAVSSQQEALLGLIRRKKIIRKPIANEASLPKSTRRLLRKFDRGKITRRELGKLDKAIRRSGSKGILERSFFADPRGRIRPSRLGVTRDNEASLTDLLTGDVTFKKNKPQILVFENVKVEKLPSAFRGIRNKLRRNMPLNRLETEKLLAYQQRITGKFKPVGFVTRESEVTLAPGELIKRRRRIGVTLINGRKVPIVSVDIVKATKSTRKLMAKARTGRLTKSEVRALRKKLRRETGFKLPSSSVTRSGKYFSVKRLGASLSSRVLSKSRSRYGRSPRSGFSGLSTGRSGSRGSRGSSGSPGRSGSSFGRSSSSSRGGSSTKLPPRPPITRPPLRPPRALKFMRGRSVRNLSKAVKAYNVYAKSGRKFIKINKIPLSRKDALNVGSYAVDNTTSKSFKIVSAGRRRRIATAPASQRGYFQKTSKKFRQFRIKRGQKFSISRHIERKRYGIDTRGEKRGLSVSRYLKGSRRSFSRPARRKSGFLSRYKPQRRSFSRPKPKYRYVQGGGLFGYRRRILVRKSGSRTNVSSRPRPLRRRRRSSGWFGGL